MERSLTKEILQHKLYSGIQPAMELLYGRYGGMLFSFILQFVSDRKEAEELLLNIFLQIVPKLQEACDSTLSIYCWLQIEARKFILEYARTDGEGRGAYHTLLRKATEEQQWVFEEIFLKGRQKEELALQIGRDSPYIDRLLRESLAIIGRNME